MRYRLKRKRDALAGTGTSRTFRMYGKVLRKPFHVSKEKSLIHESTNIIISETFPEIKTYF